MIPSPTVNLYFCGRCRRQLHKDETFLEPFTCAPDRYTDCCARSGSFTPVRVEWTDGSANSYDEPAQ